MYQADLGGRSFLSIVFSFCSFFLYREAFGPLMRSLLDPKVIGVRGDLDP